ncbi:50S ribosomal protein L29e [Venturia nashicola]|nr:50S ribosomal protein L29e [Venturia nashicola]
MFRAEYAVTRGYQYTLLANLAAAAKHQPTIHEHPHRNCSDTTSSSTNNSRRNGQTRLSTTSRRRPTGTGELSLTETQALRGGQSTDKDIPSIKKPKTHRYPSLNGTDPKFRRNHRHALHGTMKALKEVKDGKRDAA